MCVCCQWIGGTGTGSSESCQADASLTPFAKPNAGVGALGAADDKSIAYPNVVIEVAVFAGVLCKALSGSAQPEAPPCSR